MTDPKQIPHLIKLLDDESSEIRDVVSEKLTAFGPALKEELKKLAMPLNGDQEKHLGKILEIHKRAWLRHVWPNWIDLSVDRPAGAQDYKRLESALVIFSEFLSRPGDNGRLKDLLDALSLEYRVKFKDNDPALLAEFLFKDKGLRGDEDDYYNPQNSNLAYVIKEKKGIPISLTAIYMLVGMRLGVKVEGCHFPGHFLGRINLDDKEVFVDCFNGGQIIEEENLLNIKDKAFEGMEHILQEPTDAQVMVRRFLANLIRAYQIMEDEENGALLMKLFRDMEEAADGKKIYDITPEDIINCGQSRFKSGQRVSHIRYGYHGIIVEVDDECEATDDWYYGNQTQPSRHQPWYHVLVSGSDQVTYVAESNLIEDESKEKISHSLLTYFFTTSDDGDYIRNDNPWPETDF